MKTVSQNVVFTRIWQVFAGRRQEVFGMGLKTRLGILYHRFLRVVPFTLRRWLPRAAGVRFRSATRCKGWLRGIS
jgi:hypothetical protein